MLFAKCFACAICPKPHTEQNRDDTEMQRKRAYQGPPQRVPFVKNV